MSIKTYILALTVLLCVACIKTNDGSNRPSTNSLKDIEQKHGGGRDDTLGNCTLDMFGGDNNAFLACVTQYALQRNWFPSPIAGLFSFLDWNGFDGFWQNGAVLESYANFCFYGNNTRYSNILQMAYRTLDELLHAYYPLPSFDDEGWYGVAFARIYEVTRNESFFNSSKAVYDFLWTKGWDTSMKCNGGLFFGGGHNKKITVTNGLMLINGAKMYKFTQDKKYLQQAVATFNYLYKTVMDSSTYLVADSIDIYSCDPLPNQLNRTYNNGLFIGGLVELYKVTKNNTYLNLAHKVALASIEINSVHGIFMEYCDWDDQCSHDDDGRMFKGVFVRNLRYLMDVSDSTRRQLYSEFLQRNIEFAVSNAMCVAAQNKSCNITYMDGPSKFPPQSPVFTTRWNGPFEVATPMSQADMLDLFISNINPGTKCSGKGCSYAPNVDPIPRLTCKDNPCDTKAGYSCCKFDKWATCCVPGEYCYNGGCY